MYKIEIKDNEIFKRHKKYLKDNIIPKLKDNKNRIIFEDEDIVELNSKTGKKYSKGYVQRQHDKFIKYFCVNYKIICVGKKNELIKINNEINKFFLVIRQLIDKQFKFSDKNSKYKGQIYSKVLVDLFGYNHFNEDSKSFYEIIFAEAKKQVGISAIDKSDYMNVQNKIKEILCLIFPKIKVQIESFWKGKNPRKAERKTGKLKKDFIELEEKYSLGLTIDNYDNNIFDNIWNPYIFIFSLKVRTCPYCNRQYITPILTSNGKSRGNLDHLLPKSKYPYFSMSIYNLVPVCNSCNSSLKGDKEFSFDSLNPYEESLDDYISFKADINSNDIYIKIDKKNDDKEEDIKEVLDTYKLELQYNYHKNQVKELIIKRLAYSEEYINDLITNENLSNISKDEIMENLIGYSKDSKYINNETLSKFRKDIVHQLGFETDLDDSEIINKLKSVIK